MFKVGDLVVLIDNDRIDPWVDVRYISPAGVQEITYVDDQAFTCWIKVRSTGDKIYESRFWRLATGIDVAKGKIDES